MQKRPFVSQEQLEAIAAEHPTPFHLYDEAQIRARAAELKDAFSWNPGCKEYFAVKATPNPWIVQILAECGCGCDCASDTELMLAEAAGVAGRNIMFSSNDTFDEDYRRADELGAIINIDSLDMVECLERALGGRVPSTVCCRVSPAEGFEAENDIMGSDEETKFGMTVPQLEEAFRALADRGVEEFGIHALLASNMLAEDYYPWLARKLFSEAARLHQELGVRVGFINLSGGIGVPYLPDEEPCDIHAIGEAVREAFEEILVPAGMDDVAIYTELGRWMLAPAGGLVTRVIHEKVTYKDYLGVDACAANLMRPAIYDAYHHITVMGKEDEPADHIYNVVGGLCENNDQFAHDRALPKTEVGDLLFIHDAGAHGFSMGYNYNGRLRSAELLLHEDGTCQQIRRAETPADYFATFDADPRFSALAARRK